MTATAYLLPPDTAVELRVDTGIAIPDRPALRLVDAPAATGYEGFNPAVEARRRRRFVAALILSLAVIVAAYSAGFTLTSFGPVQAEPSAEAPYVHVVRPGDSYGAIASILGAEDPNAGAEILRANNGGGELVVGQQLVIPAGTLGG